MKGKVLSVVTVEMADYSEKYRVDILFDKEPPFRIGDCEVKQTK